MLQIKSGVVIHVDYHVEHLDKDGERIARYSFINDKIAPEVFNRYGQDYALNTFQIGVSADTSHDVKGCLIPVAKANLKNRIAETTTRVDHSLLMVDSEITIRIGNLTEETTGVTIREMGIEGISRIILKDETQSLDGILIRPEESLKFTLLFTYTYYTNDKILTLGEDTFGKEVDYTSEVFVNPRYKHTTLDNARGFNSATTLEIFPMTEDLAGVPVTELTIPTEDEYQQQTYIVDYSSHRADVNVLGYSPTGLHIYGFVMINHLHGIVTLVRFSEYVEVDALTRYEVGGYIGWGSSAGEIDDGYSSVDIEGYQPEELSLNISFNSPKVNRIIPSNDVAVQIRTLPSMAVYLPDGDVIEIPQGSSIADIRKIMNELDLDLELYTDRPDTLQPSTLDFIRPDKMVHDAVIAEYPDVDTIKPVLITAGNYSDNAKLDENSWRWIQQYPYFGVPVKYLCYSMAKITKAKYALGVVNDVFPEDIVTTLTTSYADAPEVGERIFTASQLLALTYPTTTDDLVVVQKVVTGAVTDPSVSNYGETYRYESDYDTERYRDWVKGSSEIQTSMSFLNLVPDYVEDPADATTKIRFVFDSKRHQSTQGDVWVNGEYIGNFSVSTLMGLKSTHGIEATLTSTAERDTVELTKPFTTTSRSVDEIYVFANGKNTFDEHEIGYIKIIDGKAGFKVFNKSGSDISNNLYLEDNAFMAMGVRLTQPEPEYLFRYKNFTSSEASRYYNQDIKLALNSNMFNMDFEDEIYSVTYTGTLDWKDPNLNSNYLFPAVGVDTSKITDVIALDAVIFKDPDGKLWTRQDLITYRAEFPEKFIGDVLWFVRPEKLVEGSVANDFTLISEYFGDKITLTYRSVVTLTYAIDSVSIQPEEVVLEPGMSHTFIATVKPEQAKISTITWTVLDTDIARVDNVNRGTVTGVYPGETTVRAVVNGLYMATAKVIVEDAELVINCDTASNPTPIMDIEGEGFGLKINGTEVATTITDEAFHNHLRQSPDFAVYNEVTLSTVTDGESDQTGFLSLEGTFDLWVGGTLIAKNLTPEQVRSALAETDAVDVFTFDK